MLISAAIAPSYDTLRPTMLDSPNAEFPVYPGLVDDLVTATDCPDPTVQHTLAVASGYAYADASTMAEMMARMGMPHNRCLQATFSVDAMFITSSAYLVQSADGRVVILAYRGTKPADVISWLGDLDAHPDQIAFPFGDSDGRTYAIHGGFYRNVRSTRYVIVEALKRAANGLPIVEPHPDGDADRARMATSNPDNSSGPLQPMSTLYVTGHSLGGAMAALMAVMLATEPEYVSRFADAFHGTYTFGQPMVGEPAFADRCRDDEFLQERTVRYVYEKDPVPHLPPTAVGKFAHFGQQYRFDADRGWDDTTDKPITQDHGFLGLLGLPLSFAARQLPILRRLPTEYEIDDHGPHHYISALTPQGVPNEFGDAHLVRPEGGFHPVPGS
ncbi:lipase family protein [Gordonia sp. CPCC 205515]|uniref:lipase family protein n=1 Tax=Gordonia sp. CPCC 205515 TaxID=3140791 RepID=UPI003AF35CFA